MVAISTASRLERHMNSKYAAKHAYHDDRIQKAALPGRNITLAYVMHESEAPVTDNKGEEEETCVVMIMGYSYRKEEWAPTVDALLTKWEESNAKSKLKLLTFDNRGCGDSDAPWGRYTTQLLAADTLALMDHVGWKDAHIVGTSMGGMISQELVLRSPERVQSLSLVVSSRGRFCPEYSALGEIIRTTFSTDPDVLASKVTSFLYPAAFLDTLIGDNSGRTNRSVVNKYHRTGSALRGPPSLSGSLGQTPALIFHYVDDDRLCQIRDHGYPILLVGAEEDIAITHSHFLHFKKILTGDHVHSVVYSDAGHAVFLQYIDEVADDILGIIRRAKSTV
ncbi:Serine protease family s33, partial [Globisporangium splendens]